MKKTPQASLDQISAKLATKHASTKPATLSIARAHSFGTCAACGYTIGCRSPRGELYLLVSGAVSYRHGGTSTRPRSYHFTCHASAIADYETGLALLALKEAK